jgi:hypothetical protein
VSFDVFLQGFQNGDGAPGRPREADDALRPYVRVDSAGHTKLITEDGEAEVYGVGTDELMLTHISGRRLWDVIVDVARAGDWAILPGDCPTCVPTADMIAHLPDELREDAVVVASGADVLDVIRGA